jgi:predicted transport protein
MDLRAHFEAVIAKYREVYNLGCICKSEYEAHLERLKKLQKLMNKC